MGKLSGLFGGGSKGGSSMPAAPDYKALAQQQYELDKKSLQDQTVANRANQYGPQGSLTWTQDPTSGQWTQNVSMSPENQAMADQLRSYQSRALGQYQGGPIDTSGMQGWSNPNLDPMSTGGMQDWSTRGTEAVDANGLTDWGDAQKLQGMAGFGGVQDVQKAMMGMLQPGLDQKRAAEQQRLKAQGLTEGSEAWNSAMQNLNMGENQAANQALLSGVSAYGDVFNRQQAANQYSDALRGAQLGERFGLSNQGMQQSNFLNNLRGQQFNEQLSGRDQAYQESALNNALREQQFNEALTQKQAPMSDFSQLSQSLNSLNPNFGGYATAGAASAPDMMGAANMSYNDLISRYNAGQASSANRASGIGGLLGAGLGGWFGGMSGAQTGAGIGSSLGGLFGG